MDCIIEGISFFLNKQNIDLIRKNRMDFAHQHYWMFSQIQRKNQHAMKIHATILIFILFLYSVNLLQM